MTAITDISDLLGQLRELTAEFGKDSTMEINLNGGVDVMVGDVRRTILSPAEIADGSYRTVFTSRARAVFEAA